MFWEIFGNIASFEAHFWPHVTPTCCFSNYKDDMCLFELFNLYKSYQIRIFLPLFPEYFYLGAIFCHMRTSGNSMNKPLDSCNIYASLESCGKLIVGWRPI